MSGCTTTPAPGPLATTSSEPTPALSDAVKAFTRFNSVLDGYAGGTSAVDEFRDLVTPEYFNQLVSDDQQRSETRVVGTSSFSEEKLVDAVQWGGNGDLALVVCLDLSRTREINPDGAETSTGARRLRSPLLISFEVVAADDVELLVTKVDQWAEDGYCL
ncbi:hypothetical protein ELQ92_09370 [Labedella populi]|uniref:Uncharacterized protein n=1 Tax=Labedella populi TaxID=2498850 RepID=A0A444QB47_9MICO|nr:hypothetical protein [Labedella populi]RWZ61221.1 hypothetical protein ELQ92_09370 [Labedella populi]